MKHIKQILLVILITSIHFFSFSQNDNVENNKPKAVKTEIGINITNLLATVVDFTENEPVEEPFDFVLKRVKQNKAFRLHFGIIGSKGLDENNTNETNTVTHFNLKLGKEWRVDMTDRFELFYGFDFLMGYRINHIKDERRNETLFFTEQEVQLSPITFLGLIFHINEKLYISTQAGFNFLFNHNWQKTVDESGFISDEVEKLNEFSFETGVPNSIYLFFKF